MSAAHLEGARPDAGRARIVRRGALIVIFYIVMSGIFFSPTLLRHKTFSTVGAVQQAYLPWRVTDPHPTIQFYPQADQAQTFYPRQAFVKRSVSARELPAWNPYTFAGVPYLSNGASTFFYPPRLLVTAAFDAVLAHDAYLLLHMAAAGCAAYFMCRTFGRTTVAALFAGLAWMWNPFFLAWSQLELIAPVIALLPAALALVRRSHDNGALRPLMGAGATCGLMLLGASLDLASAATGIVVAYAAALAASELWRQRRAGGLRKRVVVAIAKVGALGATSVALGSLSYVPFSLLQSRIARRPFTVSDLSSGVTVPLRTFLELWHHPPLPVTPDTLHLMSFCGTVVAGFAAIGLFVRRPGAGLARGLLVGTMAVLGRTPLVHVWAALSSRYLYLQLGRFMYAWGIGVVLLAALGLDRLLDLLLPDRSWRELPRRGRTMSGTTRRGMAVALVSAAFVLTARQLFVFDRAINADFLPRDHTYLFPSTPQLGELAAAERSSPGTSRVLPLNGVSPADRMVDSSIPLVFPYEQATGYDSAVPEPVAAIWQVVQGSSPHDALRGLRSGLDVVVRTDTVRADLLARLAVTTVLADPAVLDEPGWTPRELPRRNLSLRERGRGADLLDVVGAAPRAYVVHASESAVDIPSALRRFTESAFPWRTTVLLRGAGTTQASQLPGRISPPQPEAQRVIRYEGSRVDIDVDAAEAGWLVLLDSYDEGWTATVDGRASTVREANVAFRAVAVPAGHSRVVMRYHVPGLWTAAVLTVVGTAAVGVVAVEPELRRRRRRGAHRLGVGSA